MLPSVINARTPQLKVLCWGAGGRGARDLKSEARAAVVVETAQQASDGVDILVNNVGGSASIAHESWFDAPLEEWAEKYQHNVLVAVRPVKAFVPAMRERGWGRVIQISSRNAISPHAQFGGYGAAKAAVNNFTLSLSKAVSGTGDIKWHHARFDRHSSTRFLVRSDR